MQEAILAKEKMHGRMVSGRPLVVRLASEKYPMEQLSTSSKSVAEGHRSSFSSSGGGLTSRNAKIAAIKNKLRAMEEENSNHSKKQKQASTSRESFA